MGIEGIEELTNAEKAEALGVPESTVRPLRETDPGFEEHRQAELQAARDEHNRRMKSNDE